MYIKKEDFAYFEGLYNGLSELRRKKFLETLVKESSKKAGINISKIQIVGDEIFNEKSIEPDKIITRTAIKKAYKIAKEE